MLLGTSLLLLLLLLLLTLCEKEMEKMSENEVEDAMPIYERLLNDLMEVRSDSDSGSGCGGGGRRN